MKTSARAVVLLCAVTCGLAGCRNGERLRDVEMSTPLLGRALPTLEVTDLGHQPFDLGTLHGRNILLNLWATWCVPCREEMPELEHLQGLYAPEDLSIVGISFDDMDSAFIVEFLEENQITYTNLLADGVAVLDALGVNPGIPHTILIDREGVVRGHWPGRFRPSEPNTATLLRSIVTP